MKLYELSNAYRTIADQLAGMEEVSPELEQQLAAVEAELPVKVDAYCALRREFVAEAEAAKAEAKRLTALAQVRQNAAGRIWAALALELGNMGLDKYRTPRFNLWFQKNTPSTTFEGDASTLPPEYQRVKYELVSKVAVDAWKEGLPLPPGVKVEQTIGLRMK